MRQLVVIAAAWLVGCEAVPEITYINEDASLDGSLPDGNTCPNQVPAYATACCNIPDAGLSIPCSGANCAATCLDCLATCTPAELCCPNAQNHAVCRTTLTCP